MTAQEVNSLVIGEVKKVIVGKDEVIEKIWMAILAQGHVVLEDVPGVGKTTIAMSFSRALGLDVKRIQFTPDTMPSDITGFSVYDQGELKYQEGSVMTNLLLADEINRTSAKTQSALLEAMEEGRVTVDGVTHELPHPFVVLATQNPVGSAGTMNLPASQLDRFLMRLHIGYPNHAGQIDLLKARHSADPLDSVNPVLTIDQLLYIFNLVEQINIADPVYEYIVRLCEATRSHEMIQLGVSPRASLALCRVVKARAFLSGRNYVVLEDVTRVIKDVFAHRLVLSSRARIHDLSAEVILDDIVKNVPKPMMSEKNL